MIWILSSISPRKEIFCQRHQQIVSPSVAIIPSLFLKKKLRINETSLYCLSSESQKTDPSSFNLYVARIYYMVFYIHIARSDLERVLKSAAEAVRKKIMSRKNNFSNEFEMRKNFFARRSANYRNIFAFLFDFYKREAKPVPDTRTT